MPPDHPERIARYVAHGHVRHGRLEDGALARFDRAPWEGGVATGVTDPLDSVRILPPSTPTKIICVGLNYHAHLAESRSVVPGAAPPTEPLIFLKPPSALIASEEPIVYPPGVTRLDPEAELALVIGRRARRVSVEDAPAFVAGLTCMNDVSARNYQIQDGQWTRAKGFDTFAPLGPWIARGLAPHGLGIECRVNGEIRQRGDTADLIFPVPVLVSFISHIMTLEPGDVIATGTPAGVAPVGPGDRIEIEIEDVGILANPVERGPA